jgi:lipopolysaccharide export system protein LptA
MASMLRKVRVLLVVGAALLVAVIAGFVWWGRLHMLRFKLDLPKRLGVNITQESDHFSYSQSSKGKTIFTIHAAKEIQRTDGTITLHDAGIELFGRQDGRSDKIRGQEFQFDKDKGLMTGVGDVYIDLASPPGRNPGSSAKAENTIHIKTRGLVFDQKAQTAATAQGIEFQTAEMTGTAMGAEYDAKAGVLELKSAVHASGVERGRPVVLTAEWARLERQLNLLLLRGARYTGQGTSCAESVAADQAQVHLTEDGIPRQIEGQGHVVLTGQDQGTLSGERMDLALTPAGKPETSRLWGAVRYGFDSPNKKATGAAREIRVAFDAAGRPAHAMAVGGVQFQEQIAGGTRQLSSGLVELTFAEAVQGRTHLSDADASGHAVLRSAEQTARGTSSTEVRGDELKAHFAVVAGKDVVRTLDGTGHTVVHRVGVDGVDEVSRGTTLAVIFRQSAAGRAGSGPTGSIERAVQHGEVTIVRTAAVKAVSGKNPTAAPEVQRASGDDAVYEADGDRLTLTGGAQVMDTTSVLLADHVEILHSTGDADAEGNVRVTYLSGDRKGEPLHITAARAMEKKSAGTADFFGEATKYARMWQAGAQVQAPILSFSQNGKEIATRRLVAHGEIAGDADFVRAVLTGAAPSGAGKPKTEGSGRNIDRSARNNATMPEDSNGGPIRIAGHVMTYDEAARTVEFDGRVKVEDQQGTMTARKAIAYLADKPAAETQESRATAAGAALTGGRVNRIIATGNVLIQQPGRTGTGEQLVYTASDQTFVLTGTREAPPKVLDEAQGTTTGASLRFRSGDDSVVISGDGTAQEKVHSATRMRQ